MNKISKKIVAIVTMAMFIITMMPFAAFAGAGDVDASKSTYKVEATKVANELKVTINLKDEAGQAPANGDGTSKIKLAAAPTDATLKVSTATNLTGADDVDALKNGVAVTDTAAEVSFVLENVKAGNTEAVKVQVAANGTDYVAVPVSGSDVVAPTNAADRQTSNFLTVDSDVTVEEGETFDATFEINDNAGDATDAALDNVLVWAVEKGHDITDASSALVGYSSKKSVTDNESVSLSFSRAGEYTLYAGVVDGSEGTDVEKASKHLLGSVEGKQVVTVTAKDSGDINGVTLSNATVDSSDAKVYTANGEIEPNNTETAVHDVTATIGGKVAKDEEFTVTTSSSNVHVTLKDMDNKAVEGNKIKTDRNGMFKLTYTVEKAGSYKVYLKSADGYKVTLNVNTTNNDKNADKIALADYDAKVVDQDTVNNGSETYDQYLTGAVQYVLTDKNGNDLSGTTALDNEPAADKDDAKHGDYLKVTASPDKFKGDAKNFELVWNADKEVYTLKYNKNASKELVKGDYTVRVAVKATGDYVDVSFTVGEFDANAIESMYIDFDDQIVANATAKKGTVKYVDKNGIEKAANTDVKLGATGAGIETFTPNAPEFDLKATAGTDDKNIGSKIVVTAVDDANGMIATKEITVVAESGAYTLSFDKENGEADKDNVVTASIVDENGDVQDGITGDSVKAYAYVASQSNEDANVDITVGDVSKGKVKLNVYSDQETTADFVVAINDEENNKIYAGTLSYTFGPEDVNADTLVAMTIGSADYIVNNEVVKGDAAPYVDSNWRTMVPVRALTEAFGAEVKWDGDARTITIKDGNTTVVMTADKTTYTVNDVEKEMDTTPVIGTDARTYVPVRFVSEALGYKVTPTKDANGLTAGVVFQK